MQEYLEAEVSAQLNLLRSAGQNNPPSDLQKIIHTAIERTFMILEETI
jgi:hypothetical protein